MSSQRQAPSPQQQTTAASSGGCLSGFLLPPLAVVLVGGLLAFLALGSALDLAPAGPSPAQALPGAATPGPVAGAISPVFTPEIQYWAGAIQTWAAAAGLDPNLVATVMQIESCGDPLARSGSGAMGLFQVMPYHFASGDDPYDPDTNARRGLDYLHRSLEAAGGEARLALAGYNGGIGVIGHLELTWALETQRYAYWGSGIYLEASGSSDAPSRLHEWLETSGLSLCRQASRRLGLSPY